MKAPCTLFRRPLALFLWHRSWGPERLKSARLRRAGHTYSALVVFTGHGTLISLVRAYPKHKERDEFIAHACRKLSAGKQV